MTPAAAIGAGRLSRELHHWIEGRPALFAIVGSVAAVNGFAGKIATAIAETPLLITILDLGGISAIVWFAIGSLFLISGEPPARSDLLRWDKVVAGLTLFLSFIPLNFAGAMGLLLCGAYLAGTSIRGTPDRRLAIVLIGLTGPLIWGRFLLALIGPFLLALDARMAGLLAGVPVDGNVVSLRDGSGSLYVALGCSSVHNMSLATLLFLTLTQLLRLRFTPFLLATGIAAALAMAAVNVTRLAVLARYPQHFDLMHTGSGGTLFGAISFIAAGAIIVAGIRVALSR